MAPPCEISVRVLVPADIPAAQRLREAAGWNQTDADWRNLLSFEPRGCFAAELGGNLVGTATTTRFQPERGAGSFGWVGMVLVDPRQRRMGIGSRLLETCIAHLREAGVETVKLDATPLGKAVYDKLGFVEECAIERWEGIARPKTAACANLSGGIRIAPLEMSAELVRYDASAFGAQRGKLLEAWTRGWPECARIARTPGGALAGLALARRGARFQQIGPVLGDTPAICEALLTGALDRLAGEKVIVDFVAADAWPAELAARCGLTLQRRLIRMRLGPESPPGIPGRVLAIFGPEVG